MGEIISGNGLGYDVVFSLLKDFLDQGFSLYIDNFYTSPVLANDLFFHKTNTTGILSINSKGIPEEAICAYKEMSKSNIPRGTGVYVRDGSNVCAIWKDTKCLTVLSNKHCGHSECTIQRNSKDSSSHHVKADVPIPSSIFHYNKYMGGVDTSDQLIKYYNVL